MNRRSMLRGTATFAGVVIALPAMASLGGCTSSAPATITEQMPLVQAMADRIIPATETPGALAAGVPDYIALVAADFLTDEQRGEFIAGLQALAGKASEAGMADFAASDSAAQDTLLASLAQLAWDDPARRAFRQVRDLTVFGFYTSEAATEELAYEEIPGRYEACLPFSEVGTAWLERGGNWQQNWNA
jgi:hypothetical protein